MDSLQVAQLLVVALVLWLVVMRKPPSFWRSLDQALDRLDDELKYGGDQRRPARLPVFPAEVARRKHAELARERSQRKVPRARYVLAFLALGVFVWWLTRPA